MAKSLEERRKESKKRREEGALYASSLDVRRDQAQLRNAINYDTLQDDLTVANDIVKNTYSGWQNAESMKANRDTVFNMQKRLSAYNDYQNKYGTNWSEEQSKSLGNVLDFYNSAVASWDDTASVYGNYKNKSAYDKALEFKKLDDKYKGSSYEDIQNALKTARSNEYEYLSQYKNYNSLADFDKALSADSNNKELKQARNQYILDNAYEAYAYNKEDPEYATKSSAEYQYPVRSADEAKTLGRLLSQLTDDERRMANYIGNTQGEKAYRDYLQSIEVSVSKREYDKNFEKASQFADNHPWLSTVGTWLTNPFAEIGSTVETIAAPLFGQNYNPYANLSGVYNFGQDIRGEVSENINGAYGDAASFLYDTGNSVADVFMRNTLDKILGIGLFGNNKELVDKFMKAMTTAVGGGVFASAYKDALEKGYDPSTIYELAISQGLAEIVFEEMSLEKLLKDQSVDGLKKGIKAVLGQIGTEASEEFNTEVANMITQALILGEQSDYGRLAADLRERGYSDDEIKSEILKQGFNQLSMAALGGALSGGVLGSIGAYGQYNENRNIGDAVVQSKGVNTLGEKANGEYADYLNKKYDKNLTRATNAELGVLYKETYDTASKELYGKANDDLRASIQDRLIQLGEGEESAPVIADAIVKEVNEEKLTKEEKSVLKSETAQAVLEETMSNKLDTTISEDTVKASENLTEIKDLTANITENDIQNVDFKGKNGTITTKDGKSVSFKDANLSSNAMYMVKASTTMDDIERKAYFDNFTKGNNVRSYSEAFKLIFNKGMNSEDISYLIDNEAMRISLNGIKHITEVYKAGVEARKASVESIKNTLGNDSAFYRKWKNQFARGTFTADTINYNNLNGVQKELYHFAEALSNLGFNIELINDSKKSNGMYTHKDNSKVTLNLSATYSTDVNDDTKYKFVIPTISHEFTHLIEYNSPELFAELKEMIKDAFGEEMWNKWIEKEKTDYKHHHTGSLTTKNAESEVVARACEDMMADPDMLSKVLSQGSESTLKKLQRALADFFDKIKDFVNDILGAYKSDSVEATIIRKVDGMVDVMREVWAKGLADALKNIQGRESTDSMLKTNANETAEDIGLVIDAKTESVAPTDLNSERTWTQSEYVEDRDATAEKIAKELNVSKEQALKYIDDINSVAKKIAEDRVRYDYEANLDPNATVIKPNSEYKWSVDMSTLCAKRLLFTGTFDAIQKLLPNTAFNSEDIVLIRKIMEDRGYQVACGICYVESTRREIGVITEDFIEQYKEAQRTGNPITKGNGGALTVKGKSLYAEEGYTPTLADLNTTDIDLVKRDHPQVYEAYLAFMNARGQAKPKLLETRAEYKGEILKHFKSKTAVESRNNSGGLRVQSFSDFEVVHLIDMMQIVMDMSRVGLKSQAYTKVPAFADAFGNTGIKINLSLIAKGDGLDKNGNLIFDDVEGIDHEEAFRLRDKYSKNVGTILVGKNDAHIIAAMADPRIDFIIPFHKSSWKESLYEALGLTGYENYTDFQNEKPVDKDRKIKNFDPSEYWDFTKSGDENAKIYLAKCAEDGRIPKFPQFQNYPGYWKLLIDFKMYDNDGVGSPQQAVRPIFNDEVNQKILKEYEGGHRSFPVAQDVVDDFVEYKKTGAANNFDVSNDTLNSDRVITSQMSEEQRYKVLKDRTITINAVVDRDTFANKTKDYSLDSTYTLKESSRKKLFIKIGETFGVFKKYSNNDVKLIFNFSHGNMKESLNKQDERYEEFAKMFSCFDDVVDSAIGIEVHNRNNDGYKVDPTLKNVYVMFSAFEDGENIVPVKLEIKEFSDKQNALYVAISLENIKKDEVVTQGDTIEENSVTQYARSSTYKLADLFRKINPSDETFLKYVPKQFFENQESNDIRYSDRVDSKGNKLSNKQVEFFKDSKVRDKDGNLLVVYHGTSNEFNVFKANEFIKELNGPSLIKGYFSEDKEYSAIYGNTTAYYLNIEKPLVLDESAKTIEGWKKFFENNGITDVVFDSSVTGENDYRDTLKGGQYDDGLYFTYYELLDASNVWYGDGNLTERIAAAGFDGIQSNDEYEKAWMPFNENAIKKINNISPTGNKDVRYSERVGEENYKLDSNNIVVIDPTSFAPHDFDKRIKVTKENIYQYLSQLNGRPVKITSDGRVVLWDEIGAWEFTHSKDNEKNFVKYRKAKGESTRAINKIIETAYYKNWRENTETNDKKKDSQRGMLHYNLLFGIGDNNPIYYTAELLVRQASDENDYIYDVVHIKERGSLSELTDTVIASVGIVQRSGNKVNGNLADGQTITSAGTSQKQNASTFNTYQFKEGERVLDWGGGSWNISKKVVEGSYDDVTLETYDPFNRTDRHNQRILDEFTKNKATSLTINNVLNVIDSDDAIKNVLKESKQYLKPNGMCYIHIYTGNGSGNGNATSAGYQRNQKAREYIQFVKKYYKNVLLASGDFILASDGDIKATKLDAIHKERIKQNNKNVGNINRDMLDMRDSLYSMRQETELKRKSEEIDKITKTSKEFADWIKKDNTKHPVPDVLKQPIVELLQAIDFTSKRGLGLTGGPMKGEKTQNDLALLKAMDAIYSITVDREKLISEGEVSDLDLPPTFSEDVREMVKKLTDIHMKVQEAGVFTLQLMSLDDLKNLNQMLNILKKSVSQMNKMISAKGTVYIAPLSQETIQTANSYGQKGVQNIVQNFLENQEALPYYMFNRLGKGAMTIFTSLQDGWDAYAKNADAIIKFSKETWTGKEAREWGKELHEFTLLEKETVPGQPGKQIQVQMSTAQIMSLYCLGKRGQAQGHIFGSGLVMEDIDKLKQPFSVTITDTSFKQITDTLTERQKQVADAIQKYMNTVCSDWGNEISMERFGIKSFTEENYFPIESDPDVLNKDLSDNASSLYRLLNMSFTKELTEKANNQIIIRNIFTVFANHASDMAKYNTLALPVLDTIRWFNYKEKATNGKTTSLRKELSKAYGDQMPGYVTRFLKDLNGTQETGRGENLGRAMLKRYKTAMVGANIQTALLQPLSYIRAAAVISPKYLLKGLSKSAYEECFEKSGIAKWKELGFFDTDISKGLQSMITQDEEVYDKILEGSLKLAEWGDTFTWGWIWTAVKAEIRDTTNLKGKEFDEAVEKRFREVIYRTQVIDSTMTRSDLMRSKSLWTQSITSFMSEPTVTMNMLTDLYENIMLEYRKTGNFNASFKKYGRNISRVASVYAVSALVESALRSAMGKWKGDDKDFDELLKEHFVDEMNILNKYPIARDLVSIWQGYSVTRSEEDVFQKLYYAMNKISKALENGEWDYATTKSLLTAASELSGLPIANGMKEVIAIWNQTIGRMYPSQKIK